MTEKAESKLLSALKTNFYGCHSATFGQCPRLLPFDDKFPPLQEKNYNQSANLRDHLDQVKTEKLSDER